MSPDLEVFAQHCQRFYFSSDAESDYITSTLAKVSPADRPAYTKVQAEIRSQAHAHHLSVRRSTFQALISDPGRSDTETLVRWYSSGTEPFFHGLKAALRLQIGKGQRVVWEIDDAVFQQSGSLDFMRDAVQTMKGLGFEPNPFQEGLRQWVLTRTGDPELDAAVRVLGRGAKRGTGRMWVGTDDREPGWQGSWWFRIKYWLRSWF